jgi:hypothetical protein
MAFCGSSVPAFRTAVLLQTSPLLLPYQDPGDGNNDGHNQHQRNHDEHSPKRFTGIAVERIGVDGFYGQRDRRRSDFKRQRFNSRHSFGSALHSLTFGKRTHAS